MADKGEIKLSLLRRVGPTPAKLLAKAHNSARQAAKIRSSQGLANALLTVAPEGCYP